MLSLSMQGQTGPRADQPGLGNHLQAMSGLDFVTGHPDGEPHGPNQVLPDFIGPWMAIAALTCALEHRRQTGQGQYLDISQFESIMLYLQPALIEYGVTGASPMRRGNSSPGDAPHGVYPGKGDERWIAIAITGDAEWRALHGLLPVALRKRFDIDLATPHSPAGPRSRNRRSSPVRSRPAACAPISSATARTCSTIRSSLSAGTTSPASTRSSASA